MSWPAYLSFVALVVGLLGLALTHATLSLTYLQLVVTGLHRVRRVLSRRRVRRELDAATGTLLLGFGARLAAESA